MAQKKKIELTEEAEVEAKQKALLKQIRTAPISEIAHKIKDCSADGGRRCEESRFAIFLGAGASFQAGIKTAGQMMSEFREKILKRDCPEIIDEKKQEQWLKKNVFNKKEGNDYSKLFEAFERTQKGRQTYISKLIKDKKPTFGYAMLASIIARGYINTILTTNFDDLMFIACNKFTGVRPVIYAYGIMATEMKFSAPHTKILKMHGDYLYSALANTEKEMSLFNQDPNMKAQVAHALNEYELVVFGYSGSDDSVMKILENYPGGKEFYWCHWSKEIPNLRVLELLKAKDGTLVSIEGFDDAMYEIYKIVDFELDEVLASYEERRNEVLRFIDEFDQKYSTQVISEAIEEENLKIEIEPRTWWQYFQLAKQATTDKDLKNAERYYLKTIELKPDNAVAYNNLGFLYANKLNKIDEAFKYYQEAIKIEPNRAIIYVNLGLLYEFEFDNTKEAEKMFHKAIEIDSTNSRAYHQLAFLVYNQGKVAESIAYLYKSIEYDEKTIRPRLMLAAILNELGKRKDANELLSQAELLIKGNDYFELAGLKSLKGNKEEAIENLRFAIEKDPSQRRWIKRSVSFNWLQDDERFWEIVGRDDEKGE